MSGPLLVPLGALLIVAVLMLAEAQRSRRNEAWLRQHDAIEPTGDVYRTMQWVYPAAFVVMAIEGAVSGAPRPGMALAGAIVFVAAKGLKYWAIAALGRRWTFRVLALPDVPLVCTGPYVWMRHPNYVAVIGELVGMALLVGAAVTGPVMTVWFGWLIRARIRVEDRALRHRPCT